KRTEFARVDAALKDRCDQAQHSADDVFEVEPGQIGKVAGFRDDQFGDDADGRWSDVAGKQGKELLEQQHGRARLSKGRFQAFDIGYQLTTNDRLEEFLFAVIVKVNSSLGHFGAGGDFLETRGGKALLLKARQRGFQYF